MDSHAPQSRPQSADPSHRQTPLSSPVVASSGLSTVSSVTSPVSQSHFYHYNSPPAQIYPQVAAPYADTSAGQYPMAAMWQNPDYYRQYVDQYYREYYRQYIQQQRQTTHRSHPPPSVSSVTSLQRQPLKYGSRRSHARAIFSQHNNHLLFLDNVSAQKTLRVYSLTDLFVDYLFPNQMFHVLLRAIDTRLPFASRETCLEWIRCKRQMTTATTQLTTPTTEVNFELKLILKVIQMLLKQNGLVSGLDLSELLFDLVDFQTLNQSFVYSENEFQNNALNQFRALLIRGQKSVALSHALNTGLFAHALTLSYLSDALDDTRRHRRQGTTDDTTLKTVRKFCDTLRSDDPIAVFYNSLMNEICGKRSLFSLSFESFLILLSNERDLKSIEIQNSENTQTFRHLLDLIKSLMTSRTTATTPDDDRTTADDFVLSDELFESDLDSVLVNECLEFSRFSGKRFNPKLLDRKVKFVSILFDFGFVSNALEYCKQIRTFCDFASNPSARLLVSQLESRFYSFEDEFDQSDRQTPPTTDVYQNDSQTSAETTPEHVVRSEFRDDSPPESTPVAQEDVQSGSQFDFYSQMLPQKPMPSAVPPVANSVAPPLPPEPPLAPPLSHNVISSADMVPNFVAPPGPPLEPLEPMSFISQNNSLPKFENQNEFFAENGIPNNLDDRPNDRTTAPTTLNDSQTTETNSKDESKNKQGSGLFGKVSSLFRGRNQAHLPGNEMSLYYDPNLKQWVDKSEANGSAGGAPVGMRPPPMVPQVAPQGLRFDRKARNRYVDITRK